MEEFIFTKKQISGFSKALIPKLLETKILLLEGDLGAGKTFLAKCIIQNLLNKRIAVTSPTFNIVNVYNISNENAIYHFDLYRIKHIQELEEIGFFEAIDKGICIIEWPEMAKKFLKNYISLSIQIVNTNSRLFKYVG